MNLHSVKIEMVIVRIVMSHSLNTGVGIVVKCSDQIQHYKFISDLILVKDRLSVMSVVVGLQPKVTSKFIFNGMPRNSHMCR